MAHPPVLTSEPISPGHDRCLSLFTESRTKAGQKEEFNKLQIIETKYTLMNISIDM